MAFDPITASAAIGSGPVFAFDTFTDTDAVVKTMPYGAIAFGPENGPYVRVTDAAGFPVAQQGTWTINLGTTDSTALASILAALGGTLTVALPTGAATEAKQDDAITALSSIDTATGRIAGKYVDYDTSGGTDSVVAVGILLPASGGAVIGGTATNPIRTDPTGSTTQPISAASLPLPTDAATQTTLANVETKLGEIDAGKLEEATFTGRLGEVQATPTANTVLGRLKDLLTGIVLAAGANVVGWVNLISGQTGVAGGAGVVSAATLRVSIATDDQVSTSLNVMDDWDETDRCKVNIVAGQAGITAGAGAVAASTPRVTLASDDPAVTALQLIDNAVSGAGFNITQFAGVGITAGNGASGTGVLRVTVASDSTGQIKLAAGTAAIGSLTAGTAIVGKVGIDQTTPGTTNGVQEVPGTSGGLSTYSFLSTAAVQSAAIKASAGQAYGIHFFNKGTAPVYVRLYNQATTPGTGDAANIKWRGIVPGNTGAAGFVATIPGGIACGTGIGIRVSAAIADNDATVLAADEVMGNVLYK